ncbi:MAG: hypothetical protein KDA80_04935 [Planctomycetaceae bacterium]|nr:hypothetical protein [Planctomycetaceae bacterium]
MLGRYRIADNRDLERCRSLVRRLSGGLPAYDGVWIDALRQRGVLTLFQAQVLEQRAGDQLDVGGRFVLASIRQNDPVLSLFEGREIATPRKVLISRIARAHVTNSDCASELAALPGCLAVVEQTDWIDVVLPYALGESLSHFLIRRGRFPEPVVRTLLSQAVQLLSKHPNPHGDLRLNNLWLDRGGRLSLVNSGVRSAAIPQITIHTKLPGQAHDTVSPELFELGRRPDASSEMYALGCVAWQLLSGRPPFLSNEPLRKIAEHRSQGIPDVRTFSHNVSDELADVIRQMTSREPHHRPVSWSDLSETFRDGGTRSRQVLRRFVHTFESAAPRSPFPSATQTNGKAARWATAALMTAILIVLAWNRSPLGLPRLKKTDAATTLSASSNWSPTIEDVMESKAKAVVSAKRESADLAFLPDVDASGTVQLQAGTVYRATRLQGTDTLRISGPENGMAMIDVSDGPIPLRADRVTLDRIQFVTSQSTDGPLELAVDVESRELIVQRCSFVNHDSSYGVKTAISWTIKESEDQPKGRVLVREVLMKGLGEGLRISGPLTVAIFDNVYAGRLDSLVEMDQGAASGWEAPIRLDHCTLHNCGAVVTVGDAGGWKKSGILSFQGAETVLDLTEFGAIVRLPEGVALEPWHEHLKFATAGWIVPEGAVLAGLLPQGASEILPLPEEDLAVEGIVSGHFHFENVSGDEFVIPRLTVDSIPVRISERTPGVATAVLEGIFSTR